MVWTGPSCRAAAAAQTGNVLLLAVARLYTAPACCFCLSLLCPPHHPCNHLFHFDSTMSRVCAGLQSSVTAAPCGADAGHVQLVGPALAPSVPPNRHITIQWLVGEGLFAASPPLNICAGGREHGGAGTRWRGQISAGLAME